MSSFINGFLTSFSINTLWNSLIIAVPLILIIFFFVFGLNIIREYLLSRKVKKFLSEGGLHSSHRAFREDSFYEKW